MNRPLIHVVAGVIYNPQGQVLIAKRAAHQHQGDLWEFPGGKVEVGESPPKALARELEEELGIKAGPLEPLIQIVHHYADKSVLLDVWALHIYIGKAQGLEGQPLRWVRPQELSLYSFPAANLPILKAIVLPHTLAITGAASSRQDWFSHLQLTLATDVGAIQIRSSDIEADELLSYVPQAYKLCRAKGVRLILNSRLAPTAQLLTLPADGLHLTSRDWLDLKARPIPPHLLLSLPCHSAEELAKAATLEADMILLSPVLATTSHPDAPVLGWQHLAELCLTTTVPVFALGGLDLQHVAQARAAGAQGVAGISGFWAG